VTGPSRAFQASRCGGDGSLTSTKDTKGQDEATLRFLRKSFSDYYARAKLQLPDRFGRREWGFMFFGRDMMLRHMALRSSEEMRSFLRREAPAHSYHSTAYYEKPDAQTMKDKKWLGADLIFDLDADHIEGSAAMSYEEMLRVVKREIIRLAEEFILGDLGFDAGQVHLVFSGGRGYHIHVTDPSVLELDSRERREIVDYITGVGLDLSAGTVSPAMQEGGRASGIFRVEVVGSKGAGRFARPVLARRLPAPDAPGWEGRVARATLGLLATTSWRRPARRPPSTR
jgi:predicted DNA primase small subunit